VQYQMSKLILKPTHTFALVATMGIRW